jgi:GNAT superfamily N-acetyltransferase
MNMSINVTIKPYNLENDKEQIETMLAGNPFFLSFFHRHEIRKCNNVFVAHYDGLVVGFLSYGGLYKRTESVVYVCDKYRRNGIGTLLIKKADDYFAQNGITELSTSSYPDVEEASEIFLTKNGYQKFHSSYIMERCGEKLPECYYTVRHYQDEDYLTWHNISDAAFYIMRENVGLKPSYWYQPNDNERKRFAEESENRFVLLDNGVKAAVGVINRNELHLLAVRPDLQSHGYGRALASYMINEIIRRGEMTIKLECVVGNPVLCLYESMGFRIIDTYHFYNKFYRPDTRLKSPQGYTTVGALIDEFRIYGTLREE